VFFVCTKIYLQVERVVWGDGVMKEGIGEYIGIFVGMGCFFLRKVGGGVQTGSTRHRGHLLSYCACPG
jgi:hypothetical protein